MNDPYCVSRDTAREGFMAALKIRGFSEEFIEIAVRNRWTLVVLLQNWSSDEEEIFERLNNESKREEKSEV